MLHLLGSRQFYPGPTGGVSFPVLRFRSHKSCCPPSFAPGSSARLAFSSDIRAKLAAPTNRMPGTCAFLTSGVFSFFAHFVDSGFSLFAFLLPFVPSPHQPMPANRKSSLRQPPFPSLARADCRRLVEQSVFFLLLGQSGEPGHQRVPGWEERFLAVEDGGIGALCVVVAIELPRPQRELDAAEQGRVRVGLEVGIDQVRDLP